VNIKATIRALEICIDQINFSDCILFTDKYLTPKNPLIRVIRISKIKSSEEYSNFILRDLVSDIKTAHCLIVQWDGHLLDSARWNPDFLAYDYIGARWPQFVDGYTVGNGGFSLRSHRLMVACRDAAFNAYHPEDLAIGRGNRKWLESQGMRFAPPAIADLFATERSGDLDASFGYHGVFNMPKAIGVDAFWDVYRELDSLGSVWHDFTAILKMVGRGPGGTKRAARMIADRIRHGWQAIRMRPVRATARVQ
jgi:hypothetical protein